MELIYDSWDKKSYPKGRWIVDIKGSINSSFEISIVREGNKHGIRSYGWFDENKLYISSNFHQFTITNNFIWDSIIQIAVDTADKLNREENNI